MTHHAIKDREVETLRAEKRRWMNLADERAKEVATLKVDIERHVAITAAQQQELVDLQAALNAAIWLINNLRRLVNQEPVRNFDEAESAFENALKSLRGAEQMAGETK